MSEHTPGPWHCFCEDGYWYIYGPNNFQIDNSFNSTNPAIVEANRNLIAAAPELLDALERLVQMAEYNMIPDQRLKQARAAIAKARGE